MAVKDDAKQVIDILPNEATMDDIIHALYINTKCERGEHEIREGRGLSTGHETGHQNSRLLRAPSLPPRRRLYGRVRGRRGP